MVSRLCILLCITAICLSLSAPTDEPELISTNIPTYPVLARQAHVEGVVKVTFSLPANAENPANVEASGHPLLKTAAGENVKTWHFRNRFASERKYETKLQYRLLDPHSPARGSVSFESFHQIEILAVAPEPQTIE